MDGEGARAAAWRRRGPGRWRGRPDAAERAVRREGWPRARVAGSDVEIMLIGDARLDFTRLPGPDLRELGRKFGYAKAFKAMGILHADVTGVDDGAPRASSPLNGWRKRVLCLGRPPGPSATPSFRRCVPRHPARPVASEARCKSQRVVVPSARPAAARGGELPTAAKTPSPRSRGRPRPRRGADGRLKPFERVRRSYPRRANSSDAKSGNPRRCGTSA
mmetsp:Transcript_17778/g.55478  ORF Transcript_17778/g.55478 Transcript_17778/m.55478 type:complete len:219 (+) Transcript_17778:2296-2952(+)